MRYTSSLTATASGKIGGAVASRNRYGQYFRRLAKPVNPATEPQRSIRAAFAQVSNAWRALTGAQRTGWTNYAAAVKVPDKKGQGQMNITGNAMFTRNGTHLSYAAGKTVAEISPAPTVLEALVLPPLSGVILGSQLFINNFYELYGVGEGAALASVSVSPAKNETIGFYKGPFSLKGSIDQTSGIIDLGFTPAAGEQVFISVTLSDSDNRVSEPQILGVVPGTFDPSIARVIVTGPSEITITGTEPFTAATAAKIKVAGVAVTTATITDGTIVCALAAPPVSGDTVVVETGGSVPDMGVQPTIHLL